jgi:hypothetical protein
VREIKFRGKRKDNSEFDISDFIEVIPVNREVIGFYWNMETGEESTLILDHRTGIVDEVCTKSPTKRPERRIA